MATQWTAGTTSGQVLTAATLNTIGAVAETYTPALTAVTVNPTLGTGSFQDGRYQLLQKRAFVEGAIFFGSSGAAAGTGAYRISVPSAVSIKSNNSPIGYGLFYDSSAGFVFYPMQAFYISATTFSLVVASPAYTAASVLSSTVPVVPANFDQIRYTLCYEVA
jgi:hypothetical protein